MLTKSIVTGITLAVLAVACASRQPTPGAHPHDMSAAEHEAMAKAEYAEAEIHSAQYDPNAQGVVTRCTGGAATGARGGSLSYCVCGSVGGRSLMRGDGTPLTAGRPRTKS